MADRRAAWTIEDVAARFEEALAHLGKADAHVEQLTRGYRVPGQVIEYAAGLLPHVAPGLAPPTSVRRARGDFLRRSPMTTTSHACGSMVAGRSGCHEAWGRGKGR